MVSRPAPEDWSAVDSAMRREALGALKARLRHEPADALLRADIVRAYRETGHLDQVGRFAIGLPEGAQPDEVHAYAAMLRGLSADEDTARRLSMLPAGHDLPDRIRKATEPGSLSEEWRPWGVLVGIAWASVTALATLTMAIAYGFTIAGSNDARSVARAWTLVTGWAQVATLVLTTLWCATSSKWRATLIWACVTAIFGTCVGVIGVAFFR